MVAGLLARREPGRRLNFSDLHDKCGPFCDPMCTQLSAYEAGAGAKAGAGAVLGPSAASVSAGVAAGIGCPLRSLRPLRLLIQCTLESRDLFAQLLLLLVPTEGCYVRRHWRW